MSDEEKTLNVIDETIQAAESSFKEFIEVLETSRSALLKLESDKVELSNTKETLEKEKLLLEEEKTKLETVISTAINTQYKYFFRHFAHCSIYTSSL